MNNFLYDFMLAIISAIVGALFGFIIPKLFQKDEPTVTNNIDKQLNFNQIHIEQNKYISKTVVNKTVIVRKDSSSSNGGEIIFLYFIASLFLIYGYLKYESQISMALIIATIFLESMFITASFIITKHFTVDSKIKSILIFNIIATISIPILNYLMHNPFGGSTIDKGLIRKMIEQEGLVKLLFETNSFGFLLYQAIGVLIIFGYIIFVILGTIHILAMINLALRNRFMSFWRWLYKMTLFLCNSQKAYIGIGIMLLFLSFLFMSGILASFIMNASA